MRIFDRAAVAGGRCATRLWQGHLVDLGVQYFTAQSADFKKGAAHAPAAIPPDHLPRARREQPGNSQPAPCPAFTCCRATAISRMSYRLGSTCTSTRPSIKSPSAPPASIAWAKPTPPWSARCPARKRPASLRSSSLPRNSIPPSSRCWNMPARTSAARANATGHILPDGDGAMQSSYCREQQGRPGRWQQERLCRAGPRPSSAAPTPRHHRRNISRSSSAPTRSCGTCRPIKTPPATAIAGRMAIPGPAHKFK